MNKRLEQMHAARLVHITEVHEGDLIDTEGWWTRDTPEAQVAEFELFEVADIEVESPTCVRIDFEGEPSYGWPMDRPIVVQRRYNS